MSHSLTAENILEGNLQCATYQSQSTLSLVRICGGYNHPAVVSCLFFRDEINPACIQYTYFIFASGHPFLVHSHPFPWKIIKYYYYHCEQ